MMPYKSISLLAISCMISLVALCHTIDINTLELRKWSVNGKDKIHASFLMLKNEMVYLETEKSQTLKFPLQSFTPIDQQYIKSRYANIVRLNSPINQKQELLLSSSIDYKKIAAVLVLIMLLSILTYSFSGQYKFKYSLCILLVGCCSILYSFKMASYKRAISSTSPSAIDSAFTPFKPNVITSWDANYFYVASLGIPATHALMKGITSWQQQVPIPQCYFAPNAWSIPLNPVSASSVVPVNAAHFSRGAIAVAANGIAIFNPYTNTGVDAFLDGQLDQWGGHCGRADDYHYHTAPLHLYGSTATTLPIAYALDGFAVYGNFEPSGAAILPLDTNHGHYGGNGVYHYHGSATAPYMIKYMVGQVTEDATHQIIPQPHANPIRPGQNPLPGAVIDSCVANGTAGYTLYYTRSSQKYKVVYSWTSAGQYNFNFISPSGTTDSIYNGFTPCILPTGISDLLEDSKPIKLFPNPSHSELLIQLTSTIHPAEVKSISIINSDGQLIQYVPAFQDKLRTTDYVAGIYFVQVKTDKTTYTQKILIE